jgi:hypothetical protein
MIIENKENQYNTSASKLILGTLLNPLSKLFSNKNIINIKPLSPADRNNLKHGGFSIFLVAFILTIFEIIFFYKVVIPGVNISKKYGLKNIGDNLSDKLLKFRNKIDRNKIDRNEIEEKKILLKILLDADLPESNSVLETLQVRENRLNNKINNYVKVTGLIIIIILLFFILKLRKSIITDINFKEFKDGYKLAKITSIITVLIIIFFQYTFYLLSKKYLFTISGLKECSTKDIEAYKLYIKQKENKNICDKEAKRKIFMEMLKNKDDSLSIKVPLNVSDEKCKSLGGEKENNKCIAKINFCHYLNSERNKYENGDNELEMIFANRLKIN